MRAGAGALILFTLVAPSAFARETPLSLFIQGQFARAEAAGLAENSAEGFAIAARAVLADAMMRDQPCLDCLKHAEELSRRAVTSDPKLPEGHIYLAAAYGFRARIIGDFAAQSEGLANKIKSELDAALATDPNNPWALAALGSWHIEIAKSAGSALARWVFGARFATGREYYAKALALAPSNLVLHYQYALALAGYDLDDHRGEVEAELARAADGAAGSAYDSFVRTKARELLDTLKRGETAEALKLVRRDQGYPS